MTNNGVSRPSIELVPSDPEVDIREYISPGLYEALINPGTQAQVNRDCNAITTTLFPHPEYYQTNILLSKVSKDHKSLSYFGTDDKRVLIPGLIGLEELDYANHDKDELDQPQVVRLYNGLMLAEELTKAKIEQTPFFKASFIKQFSLERLRRQSAFDTFSDSDNTDKHVIERHRRKTIASFAAGIVMGVIFSDQDPAKFIKLLERQYDIAFHESERDYIFASILVPEQNIPQDTFPAEELGYANPMDLQLIKTVIRGKLSH